MFKVAQASTVGDLDTARNIMERIREENPQHWPHGLAAEAYDGGLYLVREKRSNAPAGFAGWQERNERVQGKTVRTGYYSIGILPEYRRQGYAKQALTKLIAEKSAGVDRVMAYIVSSNAPSLELAKSLDVPVRLKQAGFLKTACCVGRDLI